jgi:hypothetical protein
VVALLVPPVRYQVPVNVFDGVVRAGALVYSSISLVRPRGSVTVDLICSELSGQRILG